MSSNFDDKRMGIKGRPRKMIKKNKPYVPAITKVKGEKFIINNSCNTSNSTPPHCLSRSPTFVFMI